MEKHDTPSGTQKNYEPGHARVKNRNSERTKEKKKHRKKSGVFGKAKCLPPQDWGHQVATEKEKHTNCKNTTHQTKQRRNYESGDGRVKL